MILVDDQERMIRALGDLQRCMDKRGPMIIGTIPDMSPIDLLWLADHGVVGVDKCFIEMGQTRCPDTGDSLAEVRVGFLIHRMTTLTAYAGRPELVISCGGPLLFWRRVAIEKHAILPDGKLYRFASQAFVAGHSSGVFGMWEKRSEGEDVN